MAQYKKRIPEFHAPDNHILSEKNKLIKDLTEKQLNTSICLTKELSREPSFTKSKEGEKSLDSYKKYAELIDNIDIEELRSYGLTDNEIEFLNDYIKNDFTKYKNLTTLALEQKIKYIYDLIDIGQKSDDSNKLVTVHPINNLQQINEDLFSHLNTTTKLVVPSLKKRRKRIKKYLEQEPEPEINVNTSSTSNISKRSKWDVKEATNKSITPKRDMIYPSNPKQYIIEIERNKDEKMMNIAGRPFIGWKPNTNNNVLSECSTTKISIDEIKKMDRFKNYETGIPSKTLFIKNLSKSITEETLVNIFGHFDSEEKKITYRLLTGRMAGQAFITFNSVTQATNALNTINGYMYKDKPIIIEYGKSK